MKRQYFWLVVLMIVAVFAINGFAENGKISGTISYSGAKTGPVMVALLALPPDMDDPLMLQTLENPGAYEISGLPDATYFIAAFMDINGNGFPGFDEPIGIFPGPIMVENGGQVDFIDFEIKELPSGTASVSGNVNYTGAMSGEVHVYALGFTKTPFTSTHFEWGGNNEYSVQGLFSGEYLVVAFMDLDGNGMPDLTEPMGVPEQSVKLEDGEQRTGVDITMFDVTMYTSQLSGTVIYTGNQPGDIHVIAAGLSLTPISDVIADPATGDFSIPFLAGGDYYLFAYVDTNNDSAFAPTILTPGEPFSQSYLDEVNVGWGENKTGVEIYIADQGSGAISGAITYHGDAPGIIFVAAAGLSATPVILNFAPKIGPGPYPYSISYMAPGMYTVAGVIAAGIPESVEDILSCPLGFYLEDFVQVDRDTVTGIDFALEDTTISSITGTIEAPDGLSGEVFIFSLGISKTPFKELSIADAGAYEISGLGSGKYIVAAFMDVNGDSSFSLNEPVGFTEKLLTVYPEAVTANVNLKLEKRFSTEVAQTEQPGVPGNFALLPNFPNPFNPATAIQFTVPRLSKVAIKIFNLLGEEITTLVNGTIEPGIHQVTWNALDGAAGNLSSGIYICRMQADNFVSSQKITFVR